MYQIINLIVEWIIFSCFYFQKNQPKELIGEQSSKQDIKLMEFVNSINKNVFKTTFSDFLHFMYKTFSNISFSVPFPIFRFYFSLKCKKCRFYMVISYISIIIHNLINITILEFRISI